MSAINALYNVFYEYLDNMILNKMFTMIDIVVIPKFVSYHK